jgi:uncharacterized RDD family membrane protein YckC
MKSLILKRPIAYFIDFSILWCCCILPQLLAYKLFNGFPFETFSKPWHVYLWVLCTVSLPLWIYFIVREKSASKATIEKRIMKIIVTDLEGNRISFKQSFLRTFIKLVPWEITHLALLPIYFNDNPQPNAGLYIANGILLLYTAFFLLKKGTLALHDVIAKTIVSEQENKQLLK